MSPQNDVDLIYNKDLEYVEDAEDFKVTEQPRKARMIALSLGLLTLVAIGLGVFFFLDSNDIDLQKPKETQHEDFMGVVSLEAIAEHSNATDCWMALHGKAYDLTEYAPIHPGEPSLITRYCGTDATVWFDFEHSILLLPIVDPYLLGTLEGASETPSSVPTGPTTARPTISTTPDPTKAPQAATDAIEAPQQAPTIPPVATPTKNPTKEPTEIPSESPTDFPSEAPTTFPTKAPVTPNPTPTGTLEPTEYPSEFPTGFPTITPETPSPTALPIAKETPEPTPEPVALCEMEFYTVDDVAEHAGLDSCWYALYGVVYDLTYYIEDHKGGVGVILAECGTDATVSFINEKKHDVALLQKKGFAKDIIGRLGDKSGKGEVPCDELELVAVSGF